MKKRLLVLLSVVALMVVMLGLSVAPAFAKLRLLRCTNPDTGISLILLSSAKHQAKSEGYTRCHHL